MTSPTLPNLPDCPPDFADRLLMWFYDFGRHDLPWQNLTGEFDPYPVWVSEIMLQQTQVATVIGYHTRFMARFKTVFELADAPLDDVIELWAGLGYYARARNLHKTAQALAQRLRTDGGYPKSQDEWQGLSGIGQSTAGAIMAMGMGKFGVICDGNVKRVLARHFAIKDDITKSHTDKTLWAIATALTPKDKSGHYAQAMMDIGATVCTKSRPNCLFCPLNASCQAYKDGNPTDYPIKAKKSQKPTHHAYALHLHHQGKTLWIKRPDTGIWGALWCLPLYHLTKDNDESEQAVYDLLQDTLADITPSKSIRHTLTHFHWQLDLMALPIDTATKSAIDTRLKQAGVVFGWYDEQDKASLGKPKAMDKLLG